MHVCGGGGGGGGGGVVGQTEQTLVGRGYGYFLQEHNQVKDYKKRILKGLEF